MSLGPSMLLALNWWMDPQKLETGNLFLPVDWKVITTDGSLTGWGVMLGSLLVQGTRSPQERVLPINRSKEQSTEVSRK